MDIYIYATIGANASSSSSFANSHAWIVVKNNGSSVTIGNYDLQQGKSITLGAWGTGEKPWAIWYGRDVCQRNDFGTGDNTVYLKKNVLSSKASQITSTMDSYEYYNPLMNNCCHFAIKTWNSVGGSTLEIIPNPVSLRSNIMKISGHGTGINNSDFVNADQTSYAYVQ